MQGKRNLWCAYLRFPDNLKRWRLAATGKDKEDVEKQICKRLPARWAGSLVILPIAWNTPYGPTTLRQDSQPHWYG